MTTRFYLSSDGKQATARPGPETEAMIQAEGLHRVSALRWLYSQLRDPLQKVIPLALLFLGAIWRIAGAGSAALWYDEAVILYRSGLPFLQLLSNQSDLSGDLLLDLLERPLMALSHSLWLLRLPSILAGLVCLWLVWRLMKRLSFTPPQRIISAALAAFLPGLIWIGQDARSYSLVAALLLGALWFTLENGWLGMIACVGLLAYCHNTAVIFGGAVLIIFFYLRPVPLKRAIVAGAMIGVAWLPAVLRILIYKHISASFQFWAPQLTLNDFLTSIVEALWSTINLGYFFSLAALVLLLMTTPLIFSGIKARGRTAPLLAWLIPFVSMILVSCLWQTILIYRTLQPLLFPFALWLGWEIGHTQEIRNTRDHLALSLRLAWGIMLAAGLIFWSPSARGAGLDQAAARIRSQWRTGDLLIYTARSAELTFNYYLGDLPHYQYPDIVSNLRQEPGIIIPNTGDPATAERIWLAIPRSELLITPAEMNRIRQLYPYSGDPILRLEYMQAAPIEIYLEER